MSNQQPQHSKEFYELPDSEKLNAIYAITSRVADEQLELRKIVDPVQGPRRAALLALSGLLGGAAVQVAFLALLAVSCR